jgi:alpha-beta hydrolase superfamily lysophospholipase
MDCAEQQWLQRINVQDEKVKDGKADAKRGEQHRLPAPQQPLVAAELLLRHGRLDHFVRYAHFLFSRFAC